MGRPPKVKSENLESPGVYTKETDSGEYVSPYIPSEEVRVSAVKDELALLIQKNLSKELKDGNPFIGFLDEPEEAPTSVTDWVSTGNSLLDLAISNRPNGGLPVGKMVELTGLEASGKSLLAAHVLAETQKKGGIAVYLDTESAVSPEFLSAIGVNTSNMLYSQLETIEDIFQAMENIITSVRNNSKDRLVTIVVDSLAAASTKVEMEANYDKDGYATTKAILLSKAMRKITNLIANQKILVVFTNQLRMKMQAMAFADPYTTSGGKAVGFHCSVKIRVSSMGKIKKGDEVVGNKIKAQVTKNRVGPPFRTAEFEIFYDSGIDNYGSWISRLKDINVIKQSGSSYTFALPPTFEKPVGEDVKFMARDFKELVETNTTVKDYLYASLCDNLIMKYRKAGEVRVGEGLEVDSHDLVGEDD